MPLRRSLHCHLGFAVAWIIQKETSHQREALLITYDWFHGFILRSGVWYHQWNDNLNKKTPVVWLLNCFSKTHCCCWWQHTCLSCQRKGTPSTWVRMPSIYILRFSARCPFGASVWWPEPSLTPGKENCPTRSCLQQRAGRQLREVGTSPATGMNGCLGQPRRAQPASEIQQDGMSARRESRWHRGRSPHGRRWQLGPREWQAPDGSSTCSIFMWHPQVGRRGKQFLSVAMESWLACMSSEPAEEKWRLFSYIDVMKSILAEFLESKAKQVCLNTFCYLIHK